MNYLIKHWEGALSLKVSFGVNLFSATILWHFLGVVLSGFLWPMHPHQAATYSLIHLVLQAPLTVWQVVGVWRSAVRFREHTGRPAFAWALRGLTIIILLVGSIRFVTFSYVDHFHLAGLYSGLVSDPFGDFEVSLLQSGSTLRFEGGMGLGSAKRVKEMIADYDEVSTLVLESPGGWVYEGLALHKVISDASLTTYAFGECSSVCAIAFAAGTARYISDEARIGVHRFRGITQAFDSVARQDEARILLSRQGIKPAFIEEIFSVPSDSMWYPDPRRLRDANMITEVVACERLRVELAAACSRQP